MKISAIQKDVPSRKTMMIERCRFTGKNGGVSTDTVMVDIFNHLISDFQRDGRSDLGRFRIKNIKEARNLVFPCALGTTAEILKPVYQLQKFFSRYTAIDDKFSIKEVESRTLDSFLADNKRVGTLRPLDGPLTTPVLALARAKARAILGIFSEEEVFSHSRFGKRASKGIPLLNSYLDQKVLNPMSCTEHLVNSWQRALLSDPLLNRIVEESTNPDAPPLQLTEALDVVLVPKKFDKMRPITPYSTVASFLSLGVGEVMRLRLKASGLDIKKLQTKHRKIVSKASITGKHVTADLSAASTSITWQHVFRILPIDWASYLKKFQVNKLIVKKDREERVIHTETFAGMGCGFTFPLQTLIFYCLISAINELGNANKSFCSVYGDDLIYPTPIHGMVCKVFSLLGFVINQEKTFSTGNFRESCGEDCFAGVSVRPYCFEGRTQVLSSHALSAFLYKILNGLISRWSWRALPRTLFHIKKLLAIHTPSIIIVPPNFPETSGIRSDTPDYLDEWFYLVEKPRWHMKHQVGFWSFKAIQEVSEKRFVTYQHPYYWDTLRVSSDGDHAWDPYAVLEDSVNLRWIKLKKLNRKGGCRVQMKPYVDLKGSTRNALKRCVADSWLPPSQKVFKNLAQPYASVTAYDRFSFWA